MCQSMNCILLSMNLHFFLWNMFLSYTLDYKLEEYLIFAVSEMSVRNDCSQVLVSNFVNEESVREISFIFSLISFDCSKSFVINTISIVSIQQKLEASDLLCRTKITPKRSKFVSVINLQSFLMIKYIWGNKNV